MICGCPKEAANHITVHHTTAELSAVQHTAALASTTASTCMSRKEP